MSLGSRINEIRREKNMSIDDLCERSGIPKGTLSKITAGITASPTLDTVRSIANALGCRLDDLDDTPGNSEKLSISEKDHIKKYRLLDDLGREAVDSVLDVEHRRYLESLKAKKEQSRTETSAELSGDTVYFVVPEYSSPMSAGTGQLAGQEVPENVYLTKAPPRGTSYIAPVSGHSMEPTYRDGDLLFIHATAQIEIGQIGVFLMDGQQWVKQLGRGELISHNKKYRPIPMTEDIQCQGLVLGVCDESYFE